MLFSIFLLAYKYTYRASINGEFVGVENFGFQANGTYSFSVKDSTQPIIFGILPNSQYKSISKANPSKEDYCPSNLSDPTSKPKVDFSPSQILLLEGEEKTLRGQVDTESVYVFFYFSCGSSKYSATYSAEFSNPNTKLDTREFPLLILDPISIGIYAVLLTLWLINWIMNCRLKIYIHFILSAVFILATLTSAARYGVLMDSAKHHTRMSVQWIFILFNLLFLFGIFLFILLASKGWCIIRESIKFTELILAIVFTLLFLILQTINDYGRIGKYDFIIVLFMILFLVLYVWQLISSLNSATLHIRAHLLAIGNAGIDARTTPIWQKYLMYQFLQWTIIVLCLLLIVYIIVTYIFEDLIWLSTLLADVQNIVVLILLGINFRLRSKDAQNGYQMIEEPLEEQFDTSQFALQDIENMNIDDLQTGGKTWESGMPLPRPPQIIETPAIVTLESPDGTTEIAIQRGTYEEPS